MFKKHAYNESMLCDLKKKESIELIKAKARYDGNNNLPKTDQTSLSCAENDIHCSCLDLLNRAKEDAENALADENKTRQELTHSHVSRIKQIEGKLDNQITTLKAIEEPNILSLITDRIDYYSDMRTFKNKHQISRKANYTENRLWSVALLITLLVFESMLNANMLAKTNIYGIIGAWAEAIFISLANVFFGFFAGIIPTRFSFYRPHFARNSARVGLGGSILVILFFNFMFAHYRLVGTPDVADLLTAAWASAKNHPFAIFWDIKSFSLFIVGLTFSGIAAWKGFDWDDRYPFYGRMHRAWTKGKKELIKKEKSIINKAVALTQEAKKKLNDLRESTRSTTVKYSTSIDDSLAIIQRYDDKLRSLERTQSQLIKNYRETNKEIRDTPPPLYFKTPIPLPKNEAEINRDLSPALEYAEHLKKQTAELENEIDDAINRLMSKEQDVISDLHNYFKSLEKKAASGRVSAKKEAEEDEERGDS